MLFVGCTICQLVTPLEKVMATYLLHLGSSIGIILLSRTLVELLVLGINVHGDLQKLLVEERNSGFETPSHGRFVGT